MTETIETAKVYHRAPNGTQFRVELANDLGPDYAGKHDWKMFLLAAAGETDVEQELPETVMGADEAGAIENAGVYLLADPDWAKTQLTVRERQDPRVQRYVTALDVVEALIAIDDEYLNEAGEYDDGRDDAQQSLYHLLPVRERLHRWLKTEREWLAKRGRPVAQPAPAPAESENDRLRAALHAVIELHPRVTTQRRLRQRYADLLPTGAGGDPCP